MLKIIEQSQSMPIDIGLLKSCCGIPQRVSQYDQDLVKAIRHATECVEKYTRRTIICKTYEFSHSNRIIYLPRPVIQQVISVSSAGHILPEAEYKKYKVIDTTVVVLKEEYSGRDNAVTYRAGYGETPECIPTVLSHHIFDCARFLFEYPGKFEALYSYYTNELASNMNTNISVNGMREGNSRKLFLSDSEFASL